MIKNHETIKTTRQELYDWVWGLPMTKVALRLGMSDVGLKKVCRRHNIPTPGVGYWRQKEFGKAAPRPKLPNPSDDSSIEFSGPARMIGQEDPELLDEVTTMMAFEDAPKNRITVPLQVKKLHPIAEQVQKKLLKSNTNFNSMPRCWEFPKTHVTKSSIPRAVRIIDALLKGLEQRGYMHEGKIVIFGEVVGFELEELRETRLSKYGQKKVDSGERKPRYNTWDYDRVLSGKLHLSITPHWYTGTIRCNWKDGKKQRIEECLNAVVANLIILAARERESTVERAREEKKRRREAHRREAEERRQARQKARISKLGDDLFHWQKAGDLRSYLNEIRMAAEQAGGIDPETRFGKWMAWADWYTERIDPLQNGEAFRIPY